jgi:signal transduction histidine kinase
MENRNKNKQPKGTILIIDDNPSNLNLLSNMLKDNGYEVFPAISGALALQFLRSFFPDLILLDIKMPGMDGYKVCSRLKANEQTRGIPVIFVSALGEVIDKVRAFGAGGVDYIIKPFHFEEVLARIDTHITLRAMQRRQEERNEQLQREIAERRRAEEKLRESEAQLKFLSSRLLKIQEEERKRIANGIHDGIGQSLHAIKASAKEAFLRMEEGKTALAISNMKDLMFNTNFAIEEVRNIYTDLRPSLLDDLGILATINWFLREFRRACPTIGFDEEVAVEEDEVPQPIKLVMFRILQGALDNVAKHSNATRVRVSLWKVDNAIELTIKDTGSGFDPKDINLIEKGALGLATMQERVESSKGIFTVKSEEGRGTTVRAIWPSV